MTPPADAFTFEPIFIAVPAVAAIAYARAWRAERGGRWRPLVFGSGLVIVAAALNSPLETIATNYLLIAHLLQNALIADWAPPLILIGLTEAMRDTLRQRGGRLLETVTRPAYALPAWLATWYGVHAGGLYDYALRHPWALNVEHGVLIAAGLCFWWPVITQRMGPGPMLGYLATALVGATFLGLALTFISTPFYTFYQQAPRLWGIGVVRDQNLAGALMNAEQSIIFVSAIAWVFFRLLDDGEDG